jgi:hypothetical protein
LKRLRAALPELLIPAGAAAISYGAWCIYQPAGWITGGVLVLLVGIAAARRPAPPDESNL